MWLWNFIKRYKTVSLLKDVYLDYLKHLSVYKYLIAFYGDDVKEDVDELRKKLKEVRKKANVSNLSDDLTRKYALQIAELDGRIEFIEKKKEEIQKAKDSIQETVFYYDFLRGFILNGDYKDEPTDIEYNV